MSLLFAAERTVQPPGAVGLNRRSPLARGLVSLINPTSGPRDLVSGAVGTPTALAAGLTAKGKAWVFDGSSTLIDMNGLPPGLPDLSGTYTIAAIVIPNAASTARTFLQLRDAAARNAHIICGSTGVANVGVSSITASDGRVITAVNGGIYTVIGSGSNGVMVDGYINGIIGTSPGTLGFSASTQVGYTLGKRIGGTTIDGRVLLAAVWNRFLSVGEKLLFTRNPWQLLERTRNTVSVGADAGGAAALAGNAVAQAAASGSLSTQIPIAGAQVSTDSATGALTALIPLAGAAASIDIEAGVMTAQIRLAGDALSQMLASGTFGGSAAALAGSAVSADAATGVLSTQIQLSGAEISQALLAAGLTTVPSGFSGAAVSSATAASSLSTGIPLAGAASSIALSAGGLTTGILLSGVEVSACNVTGNLLVNAGFSAAALSKAAVAGALSTQIKLYAAAVAQALASASLSSGAGASQFICPRYSVSIPKSHYEVMVQKSHFMARCT